MLRNSLFERTLLIGGLSLALAACGQGPHVTAPNKAPAGSQQTSGNPDASAKTPNPSSSSGPEEPTVGPRPPVVKPQPPEPRPGGSTGTTGPTGASKPTGPATGPTGTSGSTAPTGASKPSAPSTPSTPPLPLPPPKPPEGSGKDGQKGENGKDGKNGCGPTAYAMGFKGRPLKKEELEKLVLPYQDLKQRKIPVLQIGQMTKFSPSGLPYVRNSQVTFGIDLALPAKKAITRVYKAVMTFALKKLSADGYDATEVLCFLDSRVCSGGLFTDSGWVAHINPKFWDGKKPFNTTFGERVTGHSVGKVGGETLWANDQTYVELEELIAGSSYKSALDFLYDKQVEDKIVLRTLPIVIADDTFVQSAELQLEVEEDTCISGSEAIGGSS